MLVTIMVSVLLFCHLFFVIGVLKKNFAVMDIGWGLGFVLIASLSYSQHADSLRNKITMLLIAIWGLRLAVYLLIRNYGRPEDFRYAGMRKLWGKSANLQAYFKIYLFQGFLMLVIAQSFIYPMTKELSSMSLVNYLGILIWVLGFSLEVWADSYLAWFKQQPKNKGSICQTGPWALCRFPNYFGEVFLWYGIFLLNFNFSHGWTIIAPITINFLILKVTGVPFLEKKYHANQAYNNYKKSVPRFIPFTKAN